MIVDENGDELGDDDEITLDLDAMNDVTQDPLYEACHAVSSIEEAARETDPLRSYTPLSTAMSGIAAAASESMLPHMSGMLESVSKKMLPDWESMMPSVPSSMLGSSAAFAQQPGGSFSGPVGARFVESVGGYVGPAADMIEAVNMSVGRPAAAEMIEKLGGSLSGPVGAQFMDSLGGVFESVRSAGSAVDLMSMMGADEALLDVSSVLSGAASSELDGILSGALSVSPLTDQIHELLDRQAHLHDMLSSPSLDRYAWEAPEAYSPAVERELVEPMPAFEERSDPVADALGELVAVARVQVEQLGDVAALLGRLDARADREELERVEAARVARNRHWTIVALAVFVPLAGTAATLVL